MNGEVTHPGYLPTGFTESEINVISENNLLAEIISHVPDYSPSDLSTQNYSIYYKPYASWSSTCQSSYPTTVVATQAKALDAITQDSTGTFVITII